jgi:hypothetical protein
VTNALVWGQRLRVYNLHLESKGKDDLPLQQPWEVLEDTRECPESTRVILAGHLNLIAAEPSFGRDEALSPLDQSGPRGAPRRAEASFGRKCRKRRHRMAASAHAQQDY